MPTSLPAFPKAPPENLRFEGGKCVEERVFTQGYGEKRRLFFRQINDTAAEDSTNKLQGASRVEKESQVR